MQDFHSKKVDGRSQLEAFDHVDQQVFFDDDEVIVGRRRISSSKRSRQRSIKALIAQEMTKEQKESKQNQPQNLAAGPIGIDAELATRSRIISRSERSLDHRLKNAPTMERFLALRKSKSSGQEEKPCDGWDYKRMGSFCDKSFSSNNDLLFEFAEELDSSSETSVSRATSSSGPTKRITVLKPTNYARMEGEKRIGRQQRQVVTPSKVGRISWPTRIVVLKPSPSMIQDTHLESIGSSSSLDGKRRATISVHLRNVRNEPDQESYKSCRTFGDYFPFSGHINRYFGDESSLDEMEDDCIDEDEGGFSDLEAVATRCHSSNSLCRLNDPHSPESFSHGSCSPKSSDCSEGKRRLSQRLAVTSSSVPVQEKMQVPERVHTLAEMLALDPKKAEDDAGGFTETIGRSYGTEGHGHASCLSGESCKYDESSSEQLSRSKSAPMSSANESIYSEKRDAKSLAKKSSTIRENTKSKSAKLFVMEKISSLFFSKHNKPNLELNSSVIFPDGKFKSIDGVPSSFSDSAVASRTNQASNEQKAMPYGDCDGSATSASINKLKQTTIHDKAAGSCEEPSSLECSSSLYDQPSPTSVLDAQFEDNDNKDPSNSGADVCRQEPLSRSFPIGSIARTLSFVDSGKRSSSRSSSRFFLETENDEQPHFGIVEQLVLTIKLNREMSNTVFSDSQSALNSVYPVWVESFLDCKDDGAKSLCRRSRQRLLFDSVNAALLEIEQVSLWNSHQPANAHASLRKDALFHKQVIDDVWNLVRSWFSAVEKDATGQSVNFNQLVDLILRKEVQGKWWEESKRFQVDEVMKDIAELVLHDLVEDVILEFTVRCL